MVREPGRTVHCNSTVAAMGDSIREAKDYHHTMDRLAGLVACEAFSHDAVSQSLASAVALQSDLPGLSFLR